MARNPAVLANCRALDELLTVRAVPVPQKRRNRPSNDGSPLPSKTEESLQAKAVKTVISTLFVTSPKDLTYSAAFLLIAFLLGIVIS
jgi:hypothetical protein